MLNQALVTMHCHCSEKFLLSFVPAAGLSDPYVKFKVGGRLLHKSRTIHRDLNPVWDEVFIVPIEDPFQPIIVKVSPGKFWGDLSGTSEKLGIVLHKEKFW